jgi:hypothetical protein
LHIDWNVFGLGVVLTQLDEKNQKFDVVAYASQSNSQTKVKYNSYEYKGDCLASVWVMATFHIFCLVAH